MVNAWLNRTVEYQCKEVIWRYVLLLKARDLAHYLIGKKRTLDFLKPEYQIERQDSKEMRKKILDISYTEWKKKDSPKGSCITLRKMLKRIGRLQ